MDDHMTVIMFDDLDTIITREDLLYALRREYNPEQNVFDYMLRTKLSNGHVITVKLDKELGEILAREWTQTDAGSFVGRHPMYWIIDQLSKGEKI